MITRLSTKTIGRMVCAAILALCGIQAKAQVNAQFFYDFGDDREYTTLTIEMFKGDKWGSTYFFIDQDFNYHKTDKDKDLAPGGTYFEIARALNFWQNTQLKNWSLHVEYNGGIYKHYGVNHAWLFGVEYFLHDQSFKNTLTLEALYKTIRRTHSNIPMQFTAVWTCKDIFGVKGLVFDGFADFWWENHNVDYDAEGGPEERHTVFLTEPQLWYNVGQHFGVDNLNVGTEIELTNNFGSTGGFKCRPCLGVKWNF